jgi:ATP-dependent Clp protease ATP-binding subunit ClpA
MKPFRAVRDIRTMNRLFSLAEAEAGRDGSDLPGPEHLVLAATQLTDGTATAILARVGTTVDGLRAAITRAHQDALRAVGIDSSTVDESPADPPARRGPYNLTASGQELFQATIALAHNGARRSPILGAHVVAAAGGQQHGTFARALAVLGIDRHDLVRAARAELASVQT